MSAEGEFPVPPGTVTDASGREIEVRPFGGEREALVEMYRGFDPADRAQGIPPASEPAVRDWLDVLLGEAALNVVAWDGERAVGHATLVADGDDGYELAIFVDQPYQGSGIGTALIRYLLGYGAANGVEEVWLTVERWNRPAINLYEKVGFETRDGGSFEREMSRSL